MGIAIGGFSINDTSRVAIQGKKPTGIAIQGKIAYRFKTGPVIPPSYPPPPVLTSLSVTTGPIGTVDFVMYIYGTGFAANSKARYNDVECVATNIYTGPPEYAIIQFAQPIIAGPAPILLRDPFGQDSNSLTFTGV